MGAEYRATHLYSVDSVRSRVTAASDHYGYRGSTTDGAPISLGRLLRGGGSRCPTQDDAFRDLAGRYKLPQATSSLRARATIMVLRVAPRLSVVCLRYR